jgi:hypothetical protein
MLPMFEKNKTNGAGAPEAETRPQADQSVWGALYDRIGLIALRRSAPLIGEEAPGEAALDRGARALRALMGAAEIARRIKTAEEKDRSAHEQTGKPPAFTDEDLDELYERVSARVDRIEREAEEGDQKDRDHQRGADAQIRPKSPGADLGGERS